MVDILHVFSSKFWGKFSGNIDFPKKYIFKLLREEKAWFWPNFGHFFSLTSTNVIFLKNKNYHWFSFKILSRKHIYVKKWKKNEILMSAHFFGVIQYDTKKGYGRLTSPSWLPSVSWPFAATASSSLRPLMPPALLQEERDVVPSVRPTGRPSAAARNPCIARRGRQEFARWCPRQKRPTTSFGQPHPIMQGRALELNAQKSGTGGCR